MYLHWESVGPTRVASYGWMPRATLTIPVWPTSWTSYPRVIMTSDPGGRPKWRHTTTPSAPNVTDARGGEFTLDWQFYQRVGVPDTTLAVLIPAPRKLSPHSRGP